MTDPLPIITVISVYAAQLIGFTGVAIMVYGAFKSLWMFVSCSLFTRNHLPSIRIELGKHLSLGLEFLVGKDIVESIIEPTWDDLGKLAAVIVLRTIVTLLLSWELKEAKREIQMEVTTVS